MRRLLAVVAAVMLWGCAGPAVNVPDTPSLRAGEGILVTNIVSNVGGYAVTIIDKTNVTLASAIFDVARGENFRVIVVPAGRYSWREIIVKGGYSNFRDKMDFTINAGEINYVGDLLLDVDLAAMTYRMRVRDEGGVAEQRLRTVYPGLYHAYPFTRNITVDTRR